MKQIIVGLCALFSLALPLTAQAANVAVTGGTNGPLCSSGGYFTPSQVTIASGDTVTFSVPSNDPYSGGLQIHGFPEGNFTVLPGGSYTTAAVTASVSYYGTWPSSGCMKGSGSVTVSTPSTPPPSTPAPTRTTTTTSTSSPLPAKTPPPSPSASPSPTPTSTTSPSPSPVVSPSGSPSPAAIPVASDAKPRPILFLAASIGALGLGAIAALVAVGLWIRRKLTKPPGGLDVQ